MAAVNGAGETPDIPSAAKDAANRQVGKLLDMFHAAKPAVPDGFIPGYGMPGGGDIPMPTGLYTYALIGPGVWPTESESGLENAATRLGELARMHDAAADNAYAQSERVFSESWTAGAGADAAYTHYRKEHLAHQHLAQAFRAGAGGARRLAAGIRTTKQKMRETSDQANQEIEESMKTTGLPVAEPILSKYRPMILDYSTQMHGHVADEVQMLGNEIPLPDAPVPGGGRGNAPSPNPVPPQPGGGSPDGIIGPDDSGRGTQFSRGGGAGPGLGLDGRGNAFTAPTTPSIPSLPSIPSMPSMPSLGGSGSPLSSLGTGGLGPLSGLFSGFGPGGLMGTGGNLANPALQGQAAQAISQAMTSQFGNGLAAGAGNLAPAFAAAQQAVPKAPVGPLAAPMGETAPVTAAPVAAAAPAAEAPLAGTGGAGMGAPMTPYGSVLPPSAMTTPAGGGALGAVPPPPPAGPPPGGGGGPGGPGLMPAPVRETGPARVRRETSMTDLELARATVADLAAASCVVNPGLDWAVAIARGASGLPEMWIATNEGAGYIPLGVYLPRSAPLAAGLDPDFDARWFGWFNPAETVLRTIRDRGDVVSAIATTWVTRSELISDAVEDVALGVAPSGGPTDADASRLTRGRSHRLETINPAMFDALERMDDADVDDYCREITQQVAFGGGPELPAAAQSVARTLAAARWPSVEEWAVLRREYESARLLAGSQRPGLAGIEEPDAVVRYMADYAYSRRLEALLCWDGGTPADIVYAALAAGVVMPLSSVTV
jgi:hypothetical protein